MPLFSRRPMTRAQQGLSRAISKHDAFFWLQGAAMLRDAPEFPRENQHLECVCTSQQVDRQFMPGSIPDLNDPATVGTLAYLVRCAMDKPDMCLETIEDIIVSEFGDDPNPFPYDRKAPLTEGERWALALLRMPSYGQLKAYIADDDEFIVFAASLEDAARHAGVYEDVLTHIPSWRVFYREYEQDEFPAGLQEKAEPPDDDEGEGEWRVTQTAAEWAAYYASKGIQRVMWALDT